MVAFSTASFVAFAAILTAPVTEARTSRPVLAIYALTTALAIYMGLIAVLIVAAQLTLLPFAGRRARALLVALGGVAVICLPLVVLALSRGSSQLFWVPSPDQHVLGQAARTLTSAGLPPNFHRGATGTLTLILTGALLVAGLGAIALAGRGRMPYGERVSELLIAAWFLVPLVLALVAAKAGLEVELARDSMLVVPPVALLLAWVLHHPRIPDELGWAGVAVLVVLRALQLGPSYGVSPEPWNAAADYVRSAAGADQCVAFYPQDGRMPFDYYLARGRAPGARSLTPVSPTREWSSVSPYVERYATPTQQQLAAFARSCRVLWLIASHEGLRRGPPQSLVDYRRYRALIAALDRVYPHERARKLGWAAAIHVIRFERD